MAEKQRETGDLMRFLRRGGYGNLVEKARIIAEADNAAESDPFMKTTTEETLMVALRIGLSTMDALRQRRDGRDVLLDCQRQAGTTAESFTDQEPAHV